MQNNLKDFRDNRGKRHELAFVVLSFFLSIMRSYGELNYSQLHRIMKLNHLFFEEIIGERNLRAVSYSQLKRILSGLDHENLNDINLKYFGKSIKEKNLNWYAIDGKEIRGTIDKAKGEKRSENIVQKINYKNREVKSIGFYNGSKESEKTVVKSYFKGLQDLQGLAYTFDALHTSKGLLREINTKKGIYLAQVKGNQKQLLEDCLHIHKNLSVLETFLTQEKGHGRIEIREGFLYPINTKCLDKGWKGTGIKSLIVIKRRRYITKTGKKSTKTVCFVSNQKLSYCSGKELFENARKHWLIESDNYIRDVNFGEDKIKCFESNTPRVMAVCLNWTINLLKRKNKQNNIRALREELVYNKDKIFSFF